jgi:hypothetical protein
MTRWVMNEHKSPCKRDTEDSVRDEARCLDAGFEGGGMGLQAKECKQRLLEAG